MHLGLSTVRVGPLVAAVGAFLVGLLCPPDRSIAKPIVDPDGAVPISPEELTLAVSSELGPEGLGAFAIDGRLFRAWVSAPTLGIGQTLSFDFTATRYVSELQVFPGHGANTKWFNHFARPAEVRVTWDAGEMKFTLPDERRMASLVMPGLVSTKKLVLTIEGLHGNRRHGTAISEVRILEPQKILAMDENLKGDIERLIGQLENREGRAETKDALVKHGAAAVPWLLTVAASRVDDVSLVALDALMRIGSTRGRHLLEEWLIAADPGRVDLAVEVLANHEVEGVQDPVFEIVARDPKSRTGNLALGYLARMKDERALPLLEARMASGDADALGVGARWLHGYDRAGLEVARRLLVSPQAGARRAAIEILARLGGPAAMNDLEKVVLGQDAVARSAALFVLLDEPERNLALLDRLLGNAEPAIASPIVGRLGQLKTPESLAVLVKWMVAEDRPVWYDRLIPAVVNHGREAVKAVLEHVLAHPSRADLVAEYLQRVAKEAAGEAASVLKRLTPGRAFDDFRIVLIHTLMQARAYRFADEVVAVYRAEASSTRVRRAAMEAFGFLPTQEVKDLVLEEVRSPNQTLRGLAYEAAGRLGDARAIAPALEDLERTGPSLWRPPPVDALGMLKAVQAVPLLRHNFALVDTTTKLAVLRACKLIGTREAIEILVQAAVSRDPVIRKGAQRLMEGD
jgi:HEAT repeat protein